MQSLTTAAKAYKAAAAHRSVREQEADVFRLINGRLRGAQTQGAMPRARALADNRLLWITVADLMRDPANALPPDLRANILSIGKAVEREMDRAEPNFEFLIEINENIAGGLARSN